MNNIKFKEVAEFLKLTPNEFFSVMTDLAHWYNSNRDKTGIEFEANPKHYACMNSMTIKSEKGDKFLKFHKVDKNGKDLIWPFAG